VPAIPTSPYPDAAGGAAGVSADHAHAPGCGHPLVRHGDHFDFLVGSHLYHAHGGHWDCHGELEVVDDDALSFLDAFAAHEDVSGSATPQAAGGGGGGGGSGSGGRRLHSHSGHAAAGDGGAHHAAHAHAPSLSSSPMRAAVATA
jgi:hypothetical protein